MMELINVILLAAGIMKQKHLMAKLVITRSFNLSNFITDKRSLGLVLNAAQQLKGSKARSSSAVAWRPSKYHLKRCQNEKTTLLEYFTQNNTKYINI